MGSFTMPEEVIGIPLWVPSAHDYFEIEDGGMPNGDKCLVIRGDLSTDYKAFLPAPLMSPHNICNEGDAHASKANTSWAMSCWLKLVNLSVAADDSVMLGCSRHNGGPNFDNGRNTNAPFALGTFSTNQLVWVREPLNNVSSPASGMNMVMQPSMQMFQDYWTLFVVNTTIGAVGGGITCAVYMDTYNFALASDGAANGGVSSGGVFTNSPPKYMHIGPYASGQIGRADLWRIGKWAFHDHALTIAERLAMWQAMMGTTHVHTDDFNRATPGYFWQPMAANTNFVLSGNQVVATGLTFRANVFTPDLGSPNHYAQAVFTNHAYNNFVGCRVASYGAGGALGYWGGWDGFNNCWAIKRADAANLATTTTGGGTSYPYTVRLECTTDGSNNAALSLYVNGALKLSATDSDAARYLVQSNAGVYLRGETGADVNMDSWECGTL